MSMQTISPTAVRVLAATDQGLHDTGTGRTTLAGRSVTSVTADGAIAYALVDGVELYRIDDDGPEPLARLVDGQGSALHVHQGSVWVGGHSARLWRLDASNLVPVKSFLDAPTRPEWSTPWGGPPSVFSFTSLGDDLFVSVHVGGILRTSDDGRTWQATINLHDDVHHVAAGPDGILWAATGCRGLAGSRDQGDTWTYHRQGLHRTYLLAVAATSDGVLVGASSGPQASDGAVYRFDGATFGRIGRPLPAQMHGAVGPRRLAASGRRVAVATPDGSLFISTDGGQEWHRSGDNLPRVAEIALPFEGFEIHEG